MSHILVMVEDLQKAEGYNMDYHAHEQSTQLHLFVFFFNFVDPTENMLYGLYSSISMFIKWRDERWNAASK